MSFWNRVKSRLARTIFPRARTVIHAGTAIEEEVDLPGGGLFEVEILSPSPAELTGRVLRIDADAERIPPWLFELGAGTVVRAFAPSTANKLTLRIQKSGRRRKANRVDQRMAIRRPDPDAHQRRVRALIGEPVIASLASIPSRRDMLDDCVRSLLVQCDKVRVFLNNYPETPGFLSHPRIEVRRSQDWDDRGDAGKFFWIDRDQEPGYRIVVDDDLVFPPDFAEVMCAKVAARGKRAIYATHGVLLRQPIDNYYDETSRAFTFYFGNKLDRDRGVHIGATNALCFHSSAVSMRWSDFQYRNSADIWLAIHAQEHDLPILTPARPPSWVRQSPLPLSGETIYEHSRSRTGSHFDSSRVQNAVLKRHEPLTVKTGDKAKRGVLLLVKDAEALAARADSVCGAIGEDVEPVVLLAYNRADEALDNAVRTTPIPYETHLIDTAEDPGGLVAAKSLVKKIGLDAVVCVDQNVELASSAAHSAKRNAPFRSGIAEPLCEVLTEPGGVLTETSSGAPGEAAAASFETAPSRPSTGNRLLTVNDVFERVVVLNLDRRPDRWEKVRASLDRAGIVAERFAAIDGNDPDVVKDYEAYLETPQVRVSTHLPPVRNSRDFYMHYASQRARIAYLEREGKKAIASRGAWGYLKSYQSILETALAEQAGSVLVFDDDVAFHKDLRRLFDEAMQQLPDDWLILELGTLQYSWDPPAMEPYSPLLYRTNGVCIGSHAVGMRFDVIPTLLEHALRMDMPFDTGALSAAVRSFASRSFVTYPNLAIQRLGDSDIVTSEFQKGRSVEEIAARYHWNLGDYS